MTNAGTWISYLTTGATLFSLRIMQALANLGIVAVLSRSLPEQVFATTLVLLTLALLSSKVLVFGLDVLAIKQLASNRDRSSYLSLLRSLLGGWAVLALTATALTTLGLKAWSFADVSPLLLVSWLFFAAVLSFQASALNGLGHARLAFIVSAIPAGLTLIGLLVVPASLESLAWSQICAFGVTILLAQALISRRLSHSTTAATRRNSQSIATSAVTNIVVHVTAQVPFWLVVWLGTATEVIAFGLVIRLVSPVGMILQSAQAMALPILSDAIGNGRAQTAEPKVHKITALAFAAVVMASATLFFMHGWLLDVVFGRPDVPLAAAMVWLLIALAVQTLFGPAFGTLRIADQAPKALLLSSIGLVFQVVFGAAMLMTAGLWGLALSVAIHSLGQGAAATVWVKSRVGIWLALGARQ